MGGLLKNPLSSYIGIASNFNIKENGVYKVDDNTSNEGIPSGAPKFGSLIIYGEEAWFKTMIYTPNTENYVYIKQTKDSTWGAWWAISRTKIE